MRHASSLNDDGMLYSAYVLLPQGQDKVNPGSVLLSGEMMLRYLGWTEAADRIISSMDETISSKVVTYDFARLMDGAKEVKCSEFADHLINNL